MKKSNPNHNNSKHVAKNTEKVISNEDEDPCYINANVSNFADMGYDRNRIAVKFVIDWDDDKPQSNAYPKYNYNNDFKVMKNGIYHDGENFVIVTGPIKITRGGIPRLDSKWRTKDRDREYFWLGWDKDQDACNNVFGILVDIDDFLDKEINQNNNENCIIAREIKGKVKNIKSLNFKRAVKLSPAHDDDDDDFDKKKEL